MGISFPQDAWSCKVLNGSFSKVIARMLIVLVAFEAFA